jgi:16S rRNA (guanine527-N7)-methyltransferase
VIVDEGSARAWVAALSDDPRNKTRLEQLVTLLLEANQTQNLVSRSSLSQIWQRHIADSGQLLLNVPRETNSWLDIGTGAGFPGLVVACLRPNLAITLSEPRARRVAWLRHATEQLKLPRVEVCGQPAERLPQRAYDVISARAVAPLNELIALSARFSTPTTLWRLPKGRNAKQELDGLRGWDHLFHVEQSRTDPSAGIITGTLQGRKGAKP